MAYDHFAPKRIVVRPKSHALKMQLSQIAWFWGEAISYDAVPGLPGVTAGGALGSVGLSCVAGTEVSVSQCQSCTLENGSCS